MLYICLRIMFIFRLHIMHLDYIMGPRGDHIFSALSCRLGGMFYEVKGPIPRPELTHRIPRIEWIVMTPTECQVLLIAIMRPTTSRDSNGIPLLACICNDDGVSGELLTLDTF